MTKPRYHYEDINKVCTLSKIFDMVDTSDKVLDVGCATGYLGKKLKTDKGCYVVGIEFDAYMAEMAKLGCDQVIVKDAEELDEIPFPEGFFNVMIFADVLEHLTNPAVVLKGFSRYLAPEGYVIASLPNIANWTCRLNLMLGKFDYKEYGILDRTHLRFFTFKSLNRTVEEAGLKIIYVDITENFTLPLISRVPQLQQVWHAIAIAFKTLLAYQFVVKAVKKSSQS